MAALERSALVGVIGAGTMGRGIAQVAASAGHRVRLVGQGPGMAEQAIGAIADDLARAVGKGRLTSPERDAILARLAPAHRLEELGEARLVIEAVVEDLEIKRRLFADLEALVAPETILASNTSSLSISALARGLKAPERVIGMHFFNPAPVMALVEVIDGMATSSTVSAAVFETAAAWGKVPVRARSTPGFIVNRCARPFYNEAWRVLAEQAADPATLDAVMREAGGFRMGPCELMDLIGHDVNLAVSRSIYDGFFGEPRFRPSSLQAEMVAAGRLGRKAGGGFYDYGPGAAAPSPRSETPAPAPTRVAIEGSLGPAEGLARRIESAGLPCGRVERAGPGAIVLDGALLRLTDGRSAAERAAAEGERDLVLVDLALDYARATRIAIAPAPQAGAAALAAASGLLQAVGLAVSRLDDTPGLIVARTVAMLANEAYETWFTGVAEPESIDLAMVKGVNYPLGPIAWARQLGLPYVLGVLDNLCAAYRDERYRASLAIRRQALESRRP